VEAWQAAERPGLTSVSRSLIDHWHNQSARPFPFCFCQPEAVESLIWWVEAPADY
jgi:type III restriction enzyme